MPGMGGIALAEALRVRYPDLPVVLTSGYSHVLAEEGSHGFELLHKPYSADQLGRLLQRMMRHQEVSDCVGLRLGDATMSASMRTLRGSRQS